MLARRVDASTFQPHPDHVTIVELDVRRKGEIARSSGFRRPAGWVRTVGIDLRQSPCEGGVAGTWSIWVWVTRM